MKNFEEYAEKKLNQYDSPMDTDQLWAGIDSDLRRRKKRFIWLLGPATAGGAVTLLIAVWLWKTNDLPQDKSAVKNPTETNIITAPASTEKETPASNSGDQHITTSIQTAPSGIQQSVWANKEQIAASSPNIHHLQQEPRQTITLTAAPNSGKVVQQSTGLQQKPMQVAPAVGPTFGTVVQEATVLQPEPWQVTTAPPTSVTAVEEVSDLQQTTPTTSGKAAIGKAKQDIALLPHPDGIVSSLKKPSFSLRQTGCFNWNEKKIHPFVGVYGGIQYPIRSLTLEDNEYEKMHQLRNSTETVLEAWHAGVFGGLEHRTGFGLQAGMEFQRINERFDLSYHFKDTIGTVLITTTLILAPGDTAVYEEYKPITRETDITRRNYNHYQFINIPIAVSYAFKSTRSLTPYIKAGAIINLQSAQKATIINTAWQPDLFTSENQTDNYPFKSQIGINLRAALGVRYAFGARFTFFGEAAFQYQLKAITSSDYPLAQRYQLSGLTVGAMYSIGKK